MIELNTFSLTARCPETGMLGVVISTARPAVGSLAPYVKAGAGAIATQALVNPFYGIDGLKLLDEGKNPGDVVKHVTAADEDRERRQLAIVDASGNTAAFTGRDTVPWQGHIEGEQFVAAGNMLTGPETLEKMAETFTALQKDEPFEIRMLEALKSGQNAGGDKRGKQSAALYIAAEEEYPYIDLRVDEHENPVQELFRIYEVCRKDLFPYTTNMPKRKQGGLD
ncbi:DUF1028 domain-containing protein [Bacillus marinisedimentorum]|uniref:DUF1028 domain-containing protein n=1 Tax=Bacillus marinisedimentorum TaxID=1821260 RepID=UPI0007DF0152|nr:DUF1028 domain-containing protein [Bacillus marinisedimentorum]